MHDSISKQKVIVRALIRHNIDNLYSFVGEVWLPNPSKNVLNGQNAANCDNTYP